MSTPRAGADWVLSVLLLVLAALVLPAMRPVSVSPVLKLELYKNQQPIRDLEQARRVSRQLTRWVDVLDLSRNGQFAHPRLGVLGLGEHFFMDLTTRIQVRRAGSYRFEVSSDDGFSLQIGDRRVCAFTTDRSLHSQICTVLLLEGEHRLQLSYFQGGGPAGLAVRYAVEGESDWHWLGQDSAALRFLRD